MNKKELIEELERNDKPYAVIMVEPTHTIDEDLKKAVERVGNKIKNFGKLFEELSVAGITFEKLGEALEVVEYEMNELNDIITVSKTEPVVADTVEFKTIRLDGIRTDAFIIGE
jgi:benzoyl-CoA reductase/2-hydroxyglutaryl-CoA dehydratase subunit BcrC/BadD/HgdB